MRILTLEISDKLLNLLQAQAVKANTTVEKFAVSVLNEQIYLAQLREDAQVGLDALKEGRYTEYDSVDEMMNDIIARCSNRLAKREF